MDTLERVIKIRTGGGVERCHGVRHNGSYSVASHTWGVLALLYVLWPEDFARLAPAVLFHDVPEAWVGDIPATTKRFARAVKNAAEAMEAEIFDRLGLPNVDILAPADRAKVRACDQLELYLWAHEQVVGGNQHANAIIRELEGFWRDTPLPPEADALAAAVQMARGSCALEHATDGLIREITQ